MDTPQLLLLVVGTFAVIVIGVVIAKYLLRASRRVPGEPQPDAVDCVNVAICGHMNGDNASRPDRFLAVIYDDHTAPHSLGDAVEVTVVDYNDTVDPPTFILHMVHVHPHGTTPSGNVKALVIAEYGSDQRSATAVLVCDAGGCSGRGSSELLARGIGAAFRPSVADNAPMRCTIDVSGFDPSLLSPLNRVWKLVHRGHGLQWDNGGDGSNEPRVELATERPFGTPWNLTFRLGEIVIRYTKAPEEWRALAANTFHSVAAEGVSDDAILPASVTVVPA